MNHTATITFGDCAENHKGMQIIGNLATEGFTLEDLQVAQDYFIKNKYECNIYDLRSVLPLEDQQRASPAYFLHALKGVDCLVSADEFLKEQDSLEKDTKAFMYGRVVNKKARHNLCFGPVSQEPDYENKKGRIVGYNQVPLLNKVKESLPNIIGAKAINMMAEGNYYYYDIKKTGIGYHGDSERRKVIALRLGASIPLCYQWYERSKPIGSRLLFNLNHGDIYIMSEKAVGTDWKKSSILTLRHAAGSDKYIDVK